MRILQHPQRAGWPAQTIAQVGAPIEGIAWMVPWEEPRFHRGLPIYQHPTEFVSLIPETLPVGVSGISWMKSWEPSYYHRPYETKSELQQTSMWEPSPEFLPVAISGVAWYTAWVPPYRQITNFSINQQTTAQTFRFFRVGKLRFYIMGGGR